MRRALSRDANEKAIVAALLKAGATVERLHVPCDLLVGYRGVNYLIECKLPKGPRGGTSHSKLTGDQGKFIARWRGQFAVARCPEDALRIIGAIR